MGSARLPALGWLIEPSWRQGPQGRRPGLHRSCNSARRMCQQHGCCIYSRTHPALRVRELLLHIAQVLVHDGDPVIVLLQRLVHLLQLLLQALQRASQFVTPSYRAGPRSNGDSRLPTLMSAFSALFSLFAKGGRNGSSWSSIVPLSAVVSRSGVGWQRARGACCRRGMERRPRGAGAHLW
jgi:hypothetical protein